MSNVDNNVEKGTYLQGMNVKFTHVKDKYFPNIGPTLALRSVTFIPGQPLEYARIQLQSDPTKKYSTVIAENMKKPGFVAKAGSFYGGLGPNMAKVLTKDLLRSPLYAMELGDNKLEKEVIRGAALTCLDATLTPFGRLAVMQAENGHDLKKISKALSPKDYYTGTVVTTMQSALGWAIFLGTDHFIREKFKGTTGLDTKTNKQEGMVSLLVGLTNTALMTPISLAATLSQRSNPVALRDLPGEFQRQVKSHGFLKGTCAGMGARVTLSVMSGSFNSWAKKIAQESAEKKHMQGIN